jgi:hypothetical protein
MKKKTTLEITHEVQNMNNEARWALGEKLIKDLKRKFQQQNIPIWDKEHNRPTDDWKLAVLSLETLCDLGFSICLSDAKIMAKESMKQSKEKMKK